MHYCIQYVLLVKMSFFTILSLPKLNYHLKTLDSEWFAQLVVPGTFLCVFYPGNSLELNELWKWHHREHGVTQVVATL